MSAGLNAWFAQMSVGRDRAYTSADNSYEAGSSEDWSSGSVEEPLADHRDYIYFVTTPGYDCTGVGVMPSASAMLSGVGGINHDHHVAIFELRCDAADALRAIEEHLAPHADDGVFRLTREQLDRAVMWARERFEQR